MKAILFIWMNLAMCNCVFATPPPIPIIAKELEGVVEAAVWRSGFKFTRVDLDELHSIMRTTEEKIVVEDHWIVVLSGIKGVDAKDIQDMSSYFLRNQPWDTIYQDYNIKDGRLLLWIPAGKDIRLKEGNRIALIEFSFVGWEGGGDIAYKSISVDDGKNKAIHKFQPPKNSKKPPTKKRK